MTPEMAKKNFDLETQLIDMGTVGKPDTVSHRNIFIYLAGVSLAFTLGQISPYFFVIFLGGMLLLAGILTLKDTEPVLDHIVDPVYNIFLGLELLFLLALKYLGTFIGKNTPFEKMLAQYLLFLFICVGLKFILCPVLKDKLKKKRCSLPVTAVCIGVFHNTFDYRHNSTSMYYPVWEYRVPGKTKVLNKESVIPVWESTEGEQIIRNGNQEWANMGEPHYGDERPIMIDPEHPYDVYLHTDRMVPVMVVCGMVIVILYLMILFVVK